MLKINNKDFNSIFHNDLYEDNSFNNYPYSSLNFNSYNYNTSYSYDYSSIQCHTDSVVRALGEDVISLTFNMSNIITDLNFINNTIGSILAYSSSQLVSNQNKKYDEIEKLFQDLYVKIDMGIAKAKANNFRQAEFYLKTSLNYFNRNLTANKEFLSKQGYNVYYPDIYGFYMTNILFLIFEKNNFNIIKNNNILNKIDHDLTYFISNLNVYNKFYENGLFLDILKNTYNEDFTALIDYFVNNNYKTSNEYYNKKFEYMGIILAMINNKNYIELFSMLIDDEKKEFLQFLKYVFREYKLPEKTIFKLFKHNQSLFKSHGESLMEDISMIKNFMKLFNK